MTTWMENAPCRGKDTEIFFPEVSPSLGSHSRRNSAFLAGKLAAARAICATCPYRDAECLEYARSLPEGMIDEVSIIAGRTPRELRSDQYRPKHHPISNSLRETVALYNKLIEGNSPRPMYEAAEILGIDREAIRGRLDRARRRGMNVQRVRQSFASRQ